MLIPPTDYDKLTIEEAKIIQKSLRGNIKLQPLARPAATIAGADISLNLYSEIIYAGIVVLTYPGLQPLAYSLVKSITRFPYVPGFLAFREVPALVQCLRQMPALPDLIMVDGHGIAHPRRMGIAAHLGTLTDLPTMGCAKKILFGKWQEPGLTRGSCSPIRDKEEQIGYALRTKDKVAPVFISPGHRMTMEESLSYALNSIGKYRIPEPTRQAHETVNLFRTGKLEEGYHEIAPLTPTLF